MLGFFGRQFDGLSGTASLGGWIRWLVVPRGFGFKEWIGRSEGHEIRVMTHGLRRARLLVDGQCVDRRSPLLPTKSKVPMLSSSMTSASHGVDVVEVFSRGLLAAQIEVRVAGRPVPMNLYTRAD